VLLDRAVQTSDALFRRGAQVLQADLAAYAERRGPGPVTLSDRLAVQQIVSKALAHIYGYDPTRGPLYQIVLRQANTAFVVELTAQEAQMRADLQQTPRGRAVEAVLDARVRRAQA